MQRFSDRIAFLTGAASGIGRATALRLASEGATIYGVDIDETGLSATVDQITAEGGTAVGRRCDVTSVADIRAAVADTIDQFGGLDVVGNIAGIVNHVHLADVTEDSWDQISAINLKGPFFVAQATIPHLIERNGNLINIASISGLIGQAYTIPYCATKAGLINMTRALALEFVKSDVRINAIAPGGVDTPLVQNFQLADDIDFNLMQNHIGHRPPSSAEQIAAFFAFVASDEAANIHGSILSADCGLSAA